MKTKIFEIDSFKFLRNQDLINKESDLAKNLDSAKLTFEKIQEMRIVMKENSDDLIRVFFSRNWLFKRIALILILISILSIKIAILPYILFGLSIIIICAAHQCEKTYNKAMKFSDFFKLDDPYAFESLIKTLYN